MKTIRTRILMGGLIGALVMMAYGQEEQSTTAPGETMATEQETATTERTSTTDKQTFLNEAFQGNDAEAALAELAEQKAQNSEVKDLAEHIRKDHRKANERLQKIAEKQGLSLPSAGGPLLDERNRLQNLAADQFDREYVSVMLKDHQKDIAKYESASRDLTDPELKDYAEDILPKLRAHLEHAQKAAKKLGMGIE